MLLKIGSENDHVIKLQEKLELPVDGIFGQSTSDAVKKWQTANGLKADGVVGNATWSKMFAEVTARDESGKRFDDDGDELDIDSADDKHIGTDENAAAASLHGIDLSKLKGIVPDAVIAQIPVCAEKFNINTPLRLAHFLAQCGHESAGFKATQENLNYSADGLKKLFNHHFKDVSVDDYARKPEKIGSRIYANRMGNGDEASKEGYKFRGRGYIQLTGKTNYKEFDQFIEENILSNPDLVASKYPLLSAGWFWDMRAINHSADKGADDDVVTEVTKKVNGGTIGLTDRINHFKQYYARLI